MFSVVIPLFNKRDFIQSTIESVLSQTRSNFELIVVDDGSTDGSDVLVGELSDSRIKLIKQHNSGVSTARNRGVQLSTFDWIAFLDADDLWAPFHLEMLEFLIGQYPESAFLSTRWVHIKSRHRAWFDSGLEVGTVHTERVNFFDWSCRHRDYFHTSSVGMKKSLFAELGGFRAVAPGQDVELWARAALVGNTAIASAITDGRRFDAGGIVANSKVHVETNELCPDNLPTPVLQTLSEVLGSGGYRIDRQSIKKYFDLRLSIGIGQAIETLDFRRAYMLWRLAKQKVRVRFVYVIAKGIFRLLMANLVSWKGRGSGQ